MIKKQLSLSLALLTLTSIVFKKTIRAESTIVLESTFVRILDGWPIDGKTLFDCAFLIKKMREMVHGKIINQQTKERQGLYIFHGKKYGLSALAELEKQYANDQRAQQELYKVLTQAKKDFSELTMPFLGKIKDHKMPIMKLMMESCNKRNVPNSFMLRWADTPSGKEDESFNSSMTSLADLTKFLNELCNFMSDLFNSCPKARHQYGDLLKKYRAGGTLD